LHRVTLPPEEFVKETIEIIKKAQEKGIIIRILGALAVYIHSSHDNEALELFNKLKRLEGGLIFTDLDLIAYSKQRKEIMDFFEKTLGFKCDPYVKALFGGRRLIYYHPKNLYHVDIFFDKLEFSHDIYFGEKPGAGSLELDFPTISLAHIVLEKLQIHKINWKDLVDLAVLFKAHKLCGEIGEKNKECIDEEVIASILCDDWGFWYDAVNNLNKLKQILDNAVKEGKINSEIANIIQTRIDKLLNYIDSKPKTKNWIKRSKIGTSKPWYREVEELER
jgi:hypothetical protein